MSSYVIGHVLIKTNRLKQTISSYESLGFTITYRVLPEKSHNAMIYFRDGSFLELFNPKPLQVSDKFILGLLKLLRPINPAMIKRYIYRSGYNASFFQSPIHLILERVHRE